MRPTAITETASRGDDDLKRRLGDIFKADAALRKATREKQPSHVRDEKYVDLVTNITAYMLKDKVATMANSGGSAGGRANKQQKSIENRIRGKEGRFRSGMLAKRADHSSRTVIKPDPDVPLDVLSLPREIAQVQPFEETVHARNYATLQRAVDLGADSPEGAELLRKPDGTEINLRTAPAACRTVSPATSSPAFCGTATTASSTDSRRCTRCP
jgi:DNA-directed RNA polymerase beta' subunit